MNKKIEGFIAAPLTGFNPDGSVNLEIIPRYAEMLNSNGITGVFVNGTTGEGLYLTLEERRVLARQWVESAPEDLLVIIHVGYTSQNESQALAVPKQLVDAEIEFAGILASRQIGHVDAARVPGPAGYRLRAGDDRLVLAA